MAQLRVDGRCRARGDFCVRQLHCHRAHDLVDSRPRCAGALGVAVASRFFAVGALCPHARANAGSLSTQALVNPRYAKPGLDLLSEGTPPAEVIRILTSADDDREVRQVHVLDAQGRSAPLLSNAQIRDSGMEAANFGTLAGS